MNKAVVLKSNKNLYIAGRKKDKILIITKINLQKKKIEIDYAQSGKLELKNEIMECNITKLEEGSFLLLENNLNQNADIKAKFLKI